MGFEVFDRRHTPLRGEPSVTIQKRGLISINGAAHALIDRAQVVELLFDKDRKVIALRPADASPRAYELRKPSRSGQTMLSAVAFTQAYDIDTSISRRYQPHVEDGMLCIDLTGRSIEVHGNRNKHSSARPADGGGDTE